MAGSRWTMGLESWRPMGLGAIGLVALACLAVLGLVAWHSLDDRAWQLRDIRATTDNLSRAMGQHAEDSLGNADMLLLGLVERLEAEGADARLPERLERLTAEAGGAVRGLLLHDAEGRLLAASPGPHPPGIEGSLALLHTGHHRGSTAREAHLGLPMRGALPGQWVITLSRRFNAPDGGFGGVALAAIDLADLAALAALFDMGERGAVALFRTDGMQIMRLPAVEGALGRHFAGDTVDPNSLPPGDAGDWRYVSPLDGVERIGSFARGRRYPVVALAALSYEEAMAAWSTRVMRSLLGALLLALGLALIGFRLLQQMGRRQQAEAALADREESFRMLAENASDMISRIGPDGRRRYVSPAARRIMGLEAEELVGRHALEFIHPADLPALQEVMARLRNGLREARITYRLQRPDGTEIWVEAAIRVALDPRTGEPDGVVSAVRDITERKLLEARLAALATVDPLTGLHNRRALDDALEREWRRAFREGAPLSLLLLDVDHFKDFNDSYGHSAGDTCLREIAATIGASLRRPSDLAARFGGEEFAFLLPGTEAAGAMEVAERIRIAVQALGQPHAPALGGVVTVSIGAASCQPAQGVPVDSAAALVAAADAALYAAKRSGRNRVSLAAETLHLAGG